MKDVGNTNDPYYSHRIRWDNTSHLKRLFTADFRAQMQSEDALFGELDNYLEPDRAAWHPLCRAQYLEMALFMSCYLLNSQGDRMLMANSVEGRVPFLDHRLVELGARIPPKYKIRALNEKYILKQTFADILPPEIARRPKTPYRAPISPCFGPGSANLAVELLTDDALKRSGFVEPSSVARLRAKTAEGAVGASERDEMALATVTSLQLLNHHFVTDFQPDGRRSAAS